MNVFFKKKQRESWRELSEGDSMCVWIVRRTVSVHFSQSWMISPAPGNQTKLSSEEITSKSTFWSPWIWFYNRRLVLISVGARSAFPQLSSSSHLMSPCSFPLHNCNYWMCRCHVTYHLPSCSRRLLPGSLLIVRGVLKQKLWRFNSEWLTLLIDQPLDVCSLLLAIPPEIQPFQWHSHAYRDTWQLSGQGPK